MSIINPVNDLKTSLNPKKLLRSKWTATVPQNKEKHFIVISAVLPLPPLSQIEHVELQAVYSGRSFTLPWQHLTDKSQWLQGWV